MNTSIEALLNASSKYIAHHWEKLGWVGPLSHFLALLQGWWLPLVVSDCTSAILVYYQCMKFYICARQVGGRVELWPYSQLLVRTLAIFTYLLLCEIHGYWMWVNSWSDMPLPNSAHMPQPLNPIVLRFIPFLFITTAAHFWGFNSHRKGYWSIISYSIQ